MKSGGQLESTRIDHIKSVSFLSLNWELLSLTHCTKRATVNANGTSSKRSSISFIVNGKEKSIIPPDSEKQSATKCSTDCIQEPNREEKCGPKTKLAHVKITIENKRENKIPIELLRFNHHSPIVSNVNNLFKPEVSQNLEKLVRKESWRKSQDKGQLFQEKAKHGTLHNQPSSWPWPKQCNKGQEGWHPHR